MFDMKEIKATICFYGTRKTGFAWLAAADKRRDPKPLAGGYLKDADGVERPGSFSTETEALFSACRALSVVGVSGKALVMASGGDFYQVQDIEAPRATGSVGWDVSNPED